MSDSYNLLSHHNETIQAQFLSRCLSNEAFAYNYCGKLDETDFYGVTQSRIFKWCQNLAASSKHINLIELSEQLGKKATEYIIDAIEGSGQSYGAEYMVQKLKEYSKVRKIGQIASRLAKQAKDGVPDPETAIIETAKLAKQDDSEEFSMHDLGLRAVERWENNSNDRKTYQFGIPKIDQNLMLRRGNLLYVIAPPKTGKTWFLVAASVQLAHQRHKVAFLSAEMHPDDLYARVCSYITGANISCLDSSDPQKRILLKWSESVNELNALPLRIHKTIGKNVLELAANIRYIANHGFDVVVIDYLQRFSVPNAKDLRIATNMLSTTISNLAKELNVLIICATQAGRQARQAGETEIYHGRESSVIEADADALIALTDKTEYGPETRELDIKFKISQRNGRSGAFTTKMDPITGRFAEGGKPWE